MTRRRRSRSAPARCTPSSCSSPRTEARVPRWSTTCSGTAAASRATRPARATARVAPSISGYPLPRYLGEETSMYKQVLDPVSDSLFVSSLFALIPLATLFILLGGLKLKAHVAALISLAVSILVAIIVYSMPTGQALDAGLEGMAFGLFPIMWIVWNAIWI